MVGVPDSEAVSVVEVELPGVASEGDVLTAWEVIVFELIVCGHSLGS